MNDTKTDKFISAQGKLLISKTPPPGEPDAHLFLIVSHTKEDMVGIGIQRRSTTMTFPMVLKMLGVEIPAENETEVDDYPVYLGGPNPQGGIYLIHTKDYSDKSTRHVFGNVYISNSPEAFKNLISKSKPRKWMIVHGEVFFNPGAIELMKKDPEWKVIEHDEDMIFDGTGEEEWIGYRWSDVKWQRAAKKVGILK